METNWSNRPKREVARMTKYIIDHIPRNTPCNRRPALAMAPTTITIHNTGNPASSARNERGWLTNPSNQRQASFHIAVDENEAVECVPLNEAAWHAGDGNGDGNRRSIGIEICESGNYGQTLQNAAELVACMLHERGWGIDRLKRHFDWSGKVCPRMMYSSGKWTAWDRFKLIVKKELEKMQMDKASVFVDGKQVQDAIIVNGVTYAPVRAVAEALGKTVGWDSKQKRVDVK